MIHFRNLIGTGVLVLGMMAVAGAAAGAPPRAFLDGTGHGWRSLGQEDFVNVNLDADTWTWKDGVAHCTGSPVGVIRMRKPLEEAFLSGM